MKSTERTKQKKELTNYLVEKHPELKKDFIRKFANDFVDGILQFEKELHENLVKDLGLVD